MNILCCTGGHDLGGICITDESYVGYQYAEDQGLASEHGYMYLCARRPRGLGWVPRRQTA